ncbi:16S rRNA (adenine(1518)-N(6)/adenine(1519)-N(6))-dimethyltransferase RsmA [Vallitaleaceae bacterium 9-2]
MDRISKPQRTREIIEKNAFSLKKKYGQNFLINQNILENIISGAELDPEDVVIEIGPGIGSLTQYIAEQVDQVVAIEIDKTLIPILEETLAEYGNVHIINEDILKVDLKAMIDQQYPNRKIKIVANLPYYITTPIIMKIFEEHIPVDSITIMIQEEVADRMQASPSTKEYGALSLAVQYYSHPKVLVKVPPSSFVPQPKVGSSVIRLEVNDHYKKQTEDDEFLFKLIRGAFQQRRKTLVNTLAHQPGIDISKEEIRQALKKIGVSEKIRGEALSLEQFIELAKELRKAEKS